MTKTSLAKTSATQGLPLVISRFLRWWVGELATWLPAWLTSWWRGIGHLVLIGIDDPSKAVLMRAKEGAIENIASIDLNAPDPALLGVRLDQKLTKQLGSSIRYLLCLPPDSILQRSVTLPMAVEENLRQTLAFELDRLTPFKPDQAYFDFLLGERLVESRQIIVHLAVASKATVDASLQRARMLGLPVVGATFAGDVLAHGGNMRNLLPAEVRQSPPSNSPKWRRVVLAFSAFALLAAALGIPVLQKRTAAISLLVPLAQAKQAAQETDALRDKLEKLAGIHNWLPDRKWEGHSTFRILEELSRRLPDDTFAIQLDYDGNNVQIQGESASSASLIETLEASPLFKDVGFKSQLIKIQGTGTDRFHINASLEATEKLLVATPPPGTAAGASSIKP